MSWKRSTIFQWQILLFFFLNFDYLTLCLLFLAWKNVASKSSNVIDPNVNVEQNGKDFKNNFVQVFIVISFLENNYFCNGSVQNHESSTLHYVGRPNQCLSTFKPFDIEAWWGRRLFNNITKNVWNIELSNSGF